MSRCYPFPPPGYVGNETRHESLIESIKGDKKEVKKDRKHKKKEKKRKERENDADRSKKHGHKRRRKDDIASKKVDDHSEIEFLEKSCLTVELELQTTSQNSCDSTLHTNESPSLSPSQPLGGRHNDSDAGLWIGLPGLGLKNPEVKDKKQSSSREKLDASQAAPREFVGRSDSSSADALRVCQEKITTKLSKEKKTVPLKDDKKVSKRKMSSSSSRTHPEQEKPSSSHQETIEHSKPLLCRKCPSSVAVHFLNLIENWAPDRVESKLTDSEDQEWWLLMKFGTKRHDQVSSNQKISEGSNSPMMWPTARYLPEAEVHALPFTVPF